MTRSSVVTLTIVVLIGMALVSRSLIAHGEEGPPPTQNDGGPDGPGGAQNRPPRGGVHVIPPFVRDKLNLTDDQKAQIADLEKEVKEKLAKILTPDQMKTLETTHPPRGPGSAGDQGGGNDQNGPGGQGPPPDEGGQRAPGGYAPNAPGNN